MKNNENLKSENFFRFYNVAVQKVENFFKLNFLIYGEIKKIFVCACVRVCICVCLFAYMRDNFDQFVNILSLQNVFFIANLTFC